MKPKPCKICGEIFVPEKPSNTICKKDHYSKCPICGKEVLWNSTREVEPCSKECRKERTRRNNLFKWGVEHPMQNKEVQQHHKQSMLDKYGVESPLQSEEIKARAITTNQEKYGTDWALGSSVIKEKSKQTMIERYGAKTTLESPQLRKKVEETCLEKYGYTNPGKNEEVRNRITNTTFLRYSVYNPMQSSDIMNRSHESRVSNNGSYWTVEMDQKAKQSFLEKYGYDNPSNSPEIQEKIKQSMIEKYGEGYGAYLTRNASAEVISGINKAFKLRLDGAGVESNFEFAEIPHYKYDIAVPSKKILVEIDPTYTHNSYGNHWSLIGLPPDYHIKKSKAAREYGYQCIHVFDWDDWDRVIDIIADKKIIYARQCKLYKLKIEVAKEFLLEYHLQGSVREQLLCLGLLYQGELVQVMTFGKPRYNKNYATELLRLCSKQGVAVVGGAERLFKWATSYWGVDDVISYCDISKFSGNVYERMGMKLTSVTAPQKIWYKGHESEDGRKITDNLLRQRGYDQLFGTNHGKGTSNEQLMIENGWLPVYDCGQAVYSYSSSSVLLNR